MRSSPPKTEAVAEITRPPSSFSIAPGQWFRGLRSKAVQPKPPPDVGQKAGRAHHLEIEQVDCGACGHEEIGPSRWTSWRERYPDVFARKRRQAPSGPGGV